METYPTMTSFGVEHGTTTAMPGNVPAFLIKLWKIVEDENLDNIVSWSQNGQTFKVHNQVAFAKDVLPKYYKHSNFSSFVRQVNMYGFRKIVDAQSGSLKQDKDEWVFFHQFFQKDKPELLSDIKRKAPGKDSDTKANQISTLITEVERLKTDHESVAQKLDSMRGENEMLWAEVGELRQQHRDQQTVINKLIQVFVKIVMSNKKERVTKRRALNFSNQIDSKHQRMTTQDLLPFTSTQPIYPSLSPERIYSVESPRSPYRVTEIPDATSEFEFDTSSISVIDEAPLPLPTQDGESNMQMADLVQGNTNEILYSLPIKIEDFTNCTQVPQVQSKNKEPLIVQGKGKTITILPETNKNISVKNTKPADEILFSFPEKYVEQPASTTCLSNIEPTQIGFDVINSISTDQPNEISPDYNKILNNVLPSNTETFLSTPETSIPPAISTHQSQKQPESSSQMSLVPVVPLVQIPQNPVYTRQRSFKDKQELAENVQKIGRDIEFLQGLLENQPVNYALKNLNLDMLPENLTMQDIGRLIDGSSSNTNAITGLEQTKDDQPVSPSEYIDAGFGMSDEDFLDTVLDTGSNPTS